MASSIAIPDDLYQRLVELAAFAGCEPAEVIRRLLDSLTAKQRPVDSKAPETSSKRIDPTVLGARPPRERGARVELNGQLLEVDSVRDLYEKALRVIAKKQKDQLEALLPYKTSSHRYLIAEKPRHPNGKAFFVPVEHGGLYMEAHKSYQTAVSQLSEFLSKMGVSFRYLS